MINASKVIRITNIAIAAFAVSASAAELKITKPGRHKLSDQLTLQVTSCTDPDGLVRNTLSLNCTESTVEDHCALTFGNQTWGVFAKSDAEATLITIADRWSVQTYQFYSRAERNRFRYELAGFDPEARWSMNSQDLLKGRKLSQFSDSDVVAWAKVLIPHLKKPPAAAYEPKREVRLVADDPEEVTMVRPTISRKAVGYGMLGRFIELGEKLLEESEIKHVGYSTGGVVRANFRILEKKSRDRYQRNCEKHKGRKAAFIIEGQVKQVFSLDPETKTFTFTAY